MKYLLTDAGYYFTVNQELDVKAIKGTWFDSLEALYDAVCELHSVVYEEIDGCEWIIENGRIYDDRGFSYEAPEEMTLPLETRINNFEL